MRRALPVRPWQDVPKGGSPADRPLCLPTASPLAAHGCAAMSSPDPSSIPSTSIRRGHKRQDLIEPRDQPSPKKQRVLSSATRVFVLADKLSTAEHDALRALVVDLGGMNASMSFANVILTGMRAPRRIERYLDADAVQRKVPVLHISWLYDSARERLLQSYEPYRIMGGESPSETKQTSSSLPVRDGDSAGTGGAKDLDQRRQRASSSSDKGVLDGSASSRASSAAPSDRTVSEETGDVHGQAASRDNTGKVDARSTPGTNELKGQVDAPLWRNVEYACMRPSPLKSPHNQDLIDELEVLRLQRILAGKQDMNATAYGRAISAIKAYPHPLKPNPANAKNLKGVGPKIAKLIVQYYTEGRIAESEAIRKDSAFNTMSKFMQLYGVGPKRAREYYSEGARTLDDVIKMGGSMGVHLHIDECLRILPDLQRTIPRAEVEEISRIVHEEADRILPGCTYVICGGYRRGKVESNDVDIVISLPKPPESSNNYTKRGLWDTQAQLTLMEDLLRSLKRQAFVTHVVNVTTPASAYETTYSRLDLAEVVVMPPVSDKVPVARYRRLDIILGPWETHGAAVLGWTGSRQFERDIRLFAKHKGYTVSSTIHSTSSAG